jgi:tetratricopeptide (TPR) repeat protein
MAKAAAAAGGVDARRAAEMLNKLALEAYSYAIGVDGRRAEAYSNRGWKHLALGAVDEARSDAEAALERDTTSRQAQQLLQRIADRK